MGAHRLAAEAVGRPLHVPPVEPADERGVLSGQRVERAVSEHERVALDPWLKTLGGQGLAQPREFRSGGARARAEPAALVVSRLTEGVGELGSLAGSLNGRGQDVRGEVVAPFRQGDRELAGGPAVELRGAARARAGPAAEPPELRLQQSFVAQPVQVELGGVHGHVDRGGGGLPADRVRLGGHVLVKGPAHRVGERPDAGGLRGEVHLALSKRRIV
jgi:hypothetical protein